VHRIIATWQATSGRPSILAVPIAGYRTPQPGSSILTSIQAASAAKFAGAKSIRGPAVLISSIGKSIGWSRRPLGKGGRDRQAWLPSLSPRGGLLKPDFGAPASPEYERADSGEQRRTLPTASIANAISAFMACPFGRHQPPPRTADLPAKRWHPETRKANWLSC